MNFTWSKQNIAWFEVASKQTTFYQDIVIQCRHLLNTNSSVLDLGCGLGPLSIALAPYVQSVTALDVNKIAIDFLKRKCKKLKITNVYPQVGDWRYYNLREKFDLVFLCYCNGIASSQLYSISALARKYIIGILPKYPREKSFGLDRLLPVDSSNRIRETLSCAISYLNSQQIPFQLVEHSCEFGQPFTTVEDYKNFLRFYFNIAETVLSEESILTYLKETQDGYYLPNQKESGIIIIKKEDIYETK